MVRKGIFALAAVFASIGLVENLAIADGYELNRQKDFLKDVSSADFFKELISEPLKVEVDNITTPLTLLNVAAERFGIARHNRENFIFDRSATFYNSAITLHVHAYLTNIKMANYAGAGGGFRTLEEVTDFKKNLGLIVPMLKNPAMSRMIFGEEVDPKIVNYAESIVSGRLANLRISPTSEDVFNAAAHQLAEKNAREICSERGDAFVSMVYELDKRTGSDSFPTVNMNHSYPKLIDGYDHNLVFSVGETNAPDPRLCPPRAPLRSDNPLPSIILSKVRCNSVTNEEKRTAEPPRQKEKIADRGNETEAMKRLEAERKELERIRADEQRIAQIDEQKRILDQKNAEEQRLAAQRAEKQRIIDQKNAEAQKLAAQRMEEQRITDQKNAEAQKLAAQRAEEQRIINQRKIEARKVAAKLAEEQRMLDHKKAQAQKVEEQRILDQKKAEAQRIAEQGAQEQRVLDRKKAEAQRVAEQRAEEQRILDRKKAETRRLAEQREAEQRMLDQKQAEAQKAADRRTEQQKKFDQMRQDMLEDRDGQFARLREQLAQDQKNGVFDRMREQLKEGRPGFRWGK